MKVSAVVIFTIAKTNQVCSIESLSNGKSLCNSLYNILTLAASVIQLCTVIFSHLSVLTVYVVQGSLNLIESISGGHLREPLIPWVKILIIVPCFT